MVASAQPRPAEGCLAIEVWSDSNMVEQGEALVFTERPSLNLKRVSIIDGRVFARRLGQFQPSGETHARTTISWHCEAHLFAMALTPSSTGLGIGAKKGSRPFMRSFRYGACASSARRG